MSQMSEIRMKGETTSASDDEEKGNNGKEGDVVYEARSTNGDSTETVRDRRVGVQREEKS